MKNLYFLKFSWLIDTIILMLNRLIVIFLFYSIIQSYLFKLVIDIRTNSLDFHLLGLTVDFHALLFIKSFAFQLNLYNLHHSSHFLYLKSLLLIIIKILPPCNSKVNYFWVNLSISLKWSMLWRIPFYDKIHWEAA